MTPGICGISTLKREDEELSVMESPEPVKKARATRKGRASDESCPNQLSALYWRVGGMSNCKQEASDAGSKRGAKRRSRC